MFFNQKFTLFKRQFQLFARVTPVHNSLMWGCGNRTHDGKYILFIDYDDTPQSWIEDEIRLLQEEHPDALGTAYLFQTLHGHHVVFLEKHYLGDIIKFLEMTSCDRHYKNIPMQYGRKLWVLRQSKKKNEDTIKYLGAYHNKNEPFNRYLIAPERSHAHKVYLQDMFNIPETDFKRDMAGSTLGDWDKEEYLTFGYYKIHEE